MVFAMLFFLCSCNSNNEKKVLEKTLVSSLKAPSTYKFISFEQEGTVTLADEVDDRLEYFTERLRMDSLMVESSSKSLSSYIEMQERYRRSNEESNIKKTEEELAKRKEEYSRTREMVEHLKSIESSYADSYNKPTFRTYKLIYEAQNSFGAPLKDVCYGRFNMDGELVGIKLQEDSSWETLGKFFSIPRYYELL